MNTKTDNEANVGRHAFEVAGLGVAPFRYVGTFRKVFVAHPGAPALPGSTCDYCGNCIMNECWVADVNGKRFKVGCDCIAKVGDRGLLKAYKSSPEVRKANREAKARLDADKASKAMKLFEEHKSALAELAHPYGLVDRVTGRKLTMADYYEYLFNHAGPSRRAGLLKAIPRVLSLST